ncbi:MAG: FAD-dependent thymidylate synthase [Kamptonema sp. SIO1D9]|nr:FAD-dependent thymidylate synthase [Kamptonema sp. SIO1D9]
MDKFRVEVIASTPNPQQVVWAAMHQDYSEYFVVDNRDKFPNEQRAGELIVKHLLAGDRGHFGPLEHPQITFNIGYFPHSMMQQIRTHRVGVSFDVQCLAADTEITFVNCNGETNKKLKKTIGELYDLWANGEKSVRQKNIRGRNNEPPGEYRRDCKKRIRKMRLRVLNEETGFFEIGHIQDVICSGKQPVYRLTLEDGKTLDCTQNHRLLTSQGWQTMGEAVGLITALDNRVITTQQECFILCNGLAVAGNRLDRNQQWLCDQIEKGRSAEQIAQMSQFKPILQPVNWKAKAKSSGRKLKAHPVKVVKVEYLGEQITYDLEVAGKWHNFVGNGIVVHNSFRYTGQRIIDVAAGIKDVEDVFYLRPVGKYTNRQGKRYFYSEEQRQEDVKWCKDACKRYQQSIAEGLAEEHARGLIPFDARQHFVLSCNLRSLLHLLDLRWKKDAQLEAQKFCELLFVHLQQWTPAVAEWYLESRAKKAKLSP